MSQADNGSEIEIPLRLLIIGDSYVGKTVLLQTYMGQPFDKFNTSTIGVGFERSIVPFGDKHLINAYLIDTSGQERFKAIISSTYRSVDCVLLCFDCTNLETFQSLDYWLTEIVQHAKPDVEIVLIATKVDDEKRRVVTREVAEQWKTARNLIDYIETSSANHLNVETAFHTALVAAAQKYIDSAPAADDKPSKDAHNIDISVDVDGYPVDHSFGLWGRFCGC